MDVVTTDTSSVETPAPTVDAAADVESSLAEHEAHFGPNAKRGSAAPDSTAASRTTSEAATDTDPTTGRVRQRAKSQHAGAKDVEHIAELTKRLRQAETDAGITAPERQPGESDRAYSIRRQAEIVEALRDARKPKATPSPIAQPQAQPQLREDAAPPAQSTFDKPRPKPEDFATAENPLDAYIDAVSDWRFDKRLHDAQQALVERNAQQSRAQALEHARAHAAKVQASIDAFAATHPDYHAKMDAIDDLKLPDILLETISTDDNPAQLAYTLATHQDELVDLIGFSIGLDYNPDSVALLRRRLARLTARATDVSKGASNPASTPVLVAPRPPTPLGTGPLKTGDDAPGDDDMSLSRHEKHFGPKRR